MTIKRTLATAVVGLYQHEADIDGYLGLCIVCGGELGDHARR